MFDFASKALTADITLYAGWTANRYTVDFDTNAAEVTVPSQEIVYNQHAVQPTAPTRTGYTFGGWYADAAGTQPFDFAGTAITQHTTLYARWNIHTYSVNFDSTGGSAVSAQTVEYGAKASAPNPAPTRVGYTFGGWYSDPEWKQAFNFSSIAISSSLTLYAKWTLNEYDVIFDSEGGSIVEAQKIKHGSRASEPAQEPTRTGYSFGGWYADEAWTQPFAFGSTDITGDMTLHAKWTINRYEIAFDSEGGSAVEAQTVEHGAKASAPVPEPTRVGYAFGGWYADSALKQAFDFAGTRITGDATLHAKWLINAYDVIFDSEGGSDVSAQKIEHGSKGVEPAQAPTRTGYTFGGWYTDKALTQSFDFAATPITSDLTLHAKWTINRYQVEFDSSGGSAAAPQTVEHGSKASEPAQAPTRTGYTFGGWYADEKLKQDFDFNATPITGNTTLYAKWIINRYTVAFDSEEGTSVDSQSVDYGGKAAEPAEPPTRTGYTFGGWYVDEALTKPFDFAASEITDDLVLHAKWTINRYPVEFDSSGGSAVEAQTIEHGAKAIEPAQEPTRTGYNFSGWYADEKLTEAFDFAAAPIIRNTVIYAKWTPIPYKVTFDSETGTAVDAQTVDYGQKAVEPAAPTRAGYTFGGWYEDTAFSRAFNFKTALIVGDITLHAKWTLIPAAPQPPITPPSSGGSGDGSPTPNTPAGTQTSAAPMISTNGRLTLSGGQPGEVSLGGIVKVVIPTGASDRELKIEISQVEDPSRLIGTNQNLVSPVLEINKNFKENFKKPIELTLEMNEAKLLPGQKAAIFYYNETSGAWVEVPGTTSKNGKATVSVSHFTKFAVFGVTPKAAVSFSDTAGHWAQAAIEQAASQGFVHGYADGTFKPGALVTRAEFAAMLVSALNLPAASGESNFADMAQIGVWAKPAVASAAAAGIIHGYADGTFRPNAVVTRAEMAVMLAAALGLPGSGDKAAFADAASIPSWAAGAAEALRAAGWMNGKSGGVFDAAGKASRAEAVQLLVNASGSR